MAFVAGVNIPDAKPILIALTYIYGIGKHKAAKICSAVGMDPRTRVRDLNEENFKNISNFISKNYIVEGDLRRSVRLRIKHLMDIGCYRGLRHRRGMPVRGQGTQNNAKTRRALGRRKKI
ncbi:30S ribosomal protein S13 [Rickettsiales bacterium]|nr:30S ribosomal protein S13 [Rickettsiales bacterium]